MIIIISACIFQFNIDNFKSKLFNYYLEVGELKLQSGIRMRDDNENLFHTPQSEQLAMAMKTNSHSLDWTMSDGKRDPLHTPPSELSAMKTDFTFPRVNNERWQ